MPELADVLRVVHAVVGVLFLAGLIGRWIVLAGAERAVDLPAVRTALALSGPFERIVIVSSGLVLLFGVLTAIVQGRPFLGPLQGAAVDWLFASVVLYVSLIPLVPLVFLPGGRAFTATLDEAGARGVVTPELRAAFRDPVVRAAHWYELGASTAIFILMIAKPF